jgi:hypothetical protein
MPGGRMDLVLRVPEYVKVEPGRGVSIIDEHSRVAEEQGQVMFGKFGATLGRARLQSLEASLKTECPPRLIVVIKKGDYVGFAAILAGVGSDAPAQAEACFVPRFYERLEEHQERPSTWFKLASAFEPVDLSSFFLATSGRPLLDVISETRTTMMLVRSSTLCQQG